MNDRPISIRLALPADGESLCELTAQLGYTDLNPKRFASALESLFDRNDLWILVAEDPASRQVLGFASMSQRPQLRLGGVLVTIDEFVIREGARGRGVGKALIEEAGRRARSLGARRLQLDTNRRRESYRRGFYAKSGFAEADSAVMRIEFEKDDE